MGLVAVADGAYPHADYGFLPEEVRVWAGYLGGHTPHAWTPAEVGELEAAGLQFWAIWTAPVGASIGPTTGATDGAGMVAALIAAKIPFTRPVFYDVEYSTWAANPAGARAAISAFKRAVAGAGWRHVFAYVPLAAGFDWVAHWTGVRPTELPAGVVGIQYDHALAGDRYDISVFDSSLFDTGGSDIMTPEQLTAITDHIDATVGNLAALLYDDPHRGGPSLDRIGQVVHDNTDGVRATLASIAAQLKAFTPAQFSASLAPLLAPLLPAVTQDELVGALDVVYGQAFGGHGV